MNLKKERLQSQELDFMRPCITDVKDVNENNSELIRFTAYSFFLNSLIIK